jgi:hypothetical protein
MRLMPVAVSRTAKCRLPLRAVRQCVCLCLICLTGCATRIQLPVAYEESWRASVAVAGAATATQPDTEVSISTWTSGIFGRTVVSRFDTTHGIIEIPFGASIAHPALVLKMTVKSGREESSCWAECQVTELVALGGHRVQEMEERIAKALTEYIYASGESRKIVLQKLRQAQHKCFDTLSTSPRPASAQYTSTPIHR